MMETVNKAIGMIMDEFEKEYGEDQKLEEGDEISAVFNDGIIILSLENRKLTIKVVAGEPYKFDYNLDLLEDEE